MSNHRRWAERRLQWYRQTDLEYDCTQISVCDPTTKRGKDLQPFRDFFIYSRLIVVLYFN